MHRQAAVYKGRLSSEQINDLAKNKVNEILLEFKEKLLIANIVSISADGVLEMKLVNFNRDLQTTLNKD
jgi:hypothetical protein